MPKSSDPSKSAAKAATPSPRKTLRRDAISMRELQKMSAGAIEALTHPVPIKSGERTVGVLSPHPRRISREAMRDIREAIEKAREARSKDVDARLAAYLGEPVDEE